MTDDVFGKRYADLYDTFYADKDYEAETDLIQEAVRRHGPPRARTILDLGCGTGAHAVRLAQAGFDVTGVDISEDMLAKARLRANEAAQSEVSCADIRELALGTQFDVATMMFAVLATTLRTMT